MPARWFPRPAARGDDAPESWYNEHVTPGPRDDTLRPEAARLLESALVAALVLIVALQFSPANTPILARDEGVFVYVGQGILEGKLPYRDLWDHKGPLIYYLNALGLWLAQGRLWGIWLVEAFILGAALALLYRLLRGILPRQAALAGLLIWAAGYASVMGGNIVEEYALLPSVLSLALVVRRRQRRAGFWLGVLAGLAFMLRPNEVAAPAVALLFLLHDRRTAQGWRGALASLLAAGAGFLLLTGGIAAYFASQHALRDLLDGMLLFNLRYVSNGGGPASALPAAAGYLAVPLFFAALGALPVLFTGASGLAWDQRRLLYVAAALLLAVAPLSLLSGRAYRHYYVPWLLPLSILGSYGSLWLRPGQGAAGVRKAAWGLGWSVLILAAVVSVRIRLVPLLAGGMPPAEAQAVDAIRTLPPPAGELFIWGDETSYAVMAGRRLAGRYVYLSPMLMPGYGEAVAAEVLAGLADKRPLILDASATDPGIPSLSGPVARPYLAPLYAFVHEHYEIVGRLPGKDWVIWRPR